LSVAQNQLEELIETVVKIKPVSKATKGGRKRSFSALVVVGNRNGRVGVGFGKANEVPAAIEKGIKDAKKNMFDVPLRGRTIPHSIIGRFGAAEVFMKPASQGTGVIAGSSVRALVEAAGVRDVLTKARGSTNPGTLIKAALAGIRSLRSKKEVERLRGVKI